jgi:hypothetical protein
MASQKFFIIDNPNGDSDGIIQGRDKINIGRAWNQDAPDGKFINCTLQDYWIVSEEDYKEYKQLKKQHESK